MTGQAFDGGVEDRVERRVRREREALREDGQGEHLGVGGHGEVLIVAHGCKEAQLLCVLAEAASAPGSPAGSSYPSASESRTIRFTSDCISAHATSGWSITKARNCQAGSA